MPPRSRAVGGIGPGDIQIATPLLVFRSQASIDAGDIPGAVSNELNIPVAGDIGISIAKVYGQFRIDGSASLGTDLQQMMVQELDMDTDNTDVEGGAVDVDIENSNTSRIFVQQGVLNMDLTTSGVSTVSNVDSLVIDFTGTEMVSRPLTNRNMRHHVRSVTPIAVDIDFTAMLMIYYHVVRLSDRALFLLASRRSF